MSEMGNTQEWLPVRVKSALSSLAVAEVALQSFAAAMALPHRAHPPAPQLLPSAATHGSGRRVKK